MEKLPLYKSLIEDRLSFIEKAVESLTRFKSVSLDAFEQNHDNFRIAYYDLYTALEACLDIGAHLLSRLPDQKPRFYKDTPLLLGQAGLVPKEFARDKLVPMVGFSNRMTYFYQRLEAAEILEIIKSHLSDFE